MSERMQIRVFVQLGRMIWPWSLLSRALGLLFLLAMESRRLVQRELGASPEGYAQSHQTIAPDSSLGPVRAHRGCHCYIPDDTDGLWSQGVGFGVTRQEWQTIQSTKP
ncbi:hypothetical protein B0I35DRAFT_431993 [Stachybotrys elegans]|uniref:Uncharacterized protein n=1 Tax=Stachybotrys elegans TaxID=80388 RepID=A0A8K0SM12_9HYPO|nr:hypothetical protein B0I35DRAFT_431993 [Stachybotrys elegans]